MRAAGGGGGVRILISPTDLKRGSARLTHAAAAWGLLALRLRLAWMPEMPPGIAARVQAGVSDAAGTLAGQIPELLGSSTELDRRALWTEIADELIATGTLEGTLLNRFLEGVKDGSLVRYAEPWQAELAGHYLATRYRDNYKDPEKLVELAAILHANEGYAASGAFMAGFVEGFGAVRIVDIPRVVQAMEWAPGEGPGLYSDANVDWELGYKFWSEGYRFEGDAVELLGAFSMALALATSSGRVSAEVEHDIAWDDDSWAVAQLVHEGRFGANFLKEVFQGVLMRDPELLSGGRGNHGLISYMPIGAGDNEGPAISTDAKALVLQALARSPEGAALALTTDLPERVEFISSIASNGYVSSNRPVDILLGFDAWDDDGKLVGEAMASAVAGLHADGRSFDANDMVETMIHEVVRDVDELDGLADGLARALSGDYGGAADYIRDLHVSAAAGETSLEFDFDDDGEIGSSDGEGIKISTLQLEELLGQLVERDGARDRLLAGVGAHQTAQILAGTSPGAPADHQWATDIGSFNSILAEAVSENRIDDFEDRKAIHEQIFGTADAIAGVIPTKPVTGFVTGQLIELISDATAPSERPVVDENYLYGQEMRTRMDAAIIAGYYENGVLGSHEQVERQVEQLDTPGFEPQSFFDRDGNIIPYGDMNEAQQATFDAWKRTHHVQTVVEDALQVANQGVDTRARDD